MSSLTDGFSILGLTDRRSIEASLLERKVPADQAAALSELCDSLAEALQFVGGATQGGNGFRSPWKEYYSLKYQRFYYVHEDGQNVWDIPNSVLLQDWLLDAQMFNVHITVARDVFLVLNQMLQANWHQATELWEAVGLLARIINNVVQCRNTVEKYRSVKTDNPKFKEKVAAIPGALQVLEAAGFRQQRDTVVFPASTSSSEATSSSGECAVLQRATLVGSKLAQLHDRKGFTGAAITHDDTASTSSSRHAGLPGFRFQQEIYECSLCERPINDGSERLFSGKHDSPKGEFRYECEVCPPSPGFNMCETCWDNHFKGGQLHPASHTFRTHHPKMSRHNCYTKETASNPFGQFAGGGAGVGRALARLRERTGTTFM